MEAALGNKGMAGCATHTYAPTKYTHRILRQRENKPTELCRNTDTEKILQQTYTHTHAVNLELYIH